MTKPVNILFLAPLNFFEQKIKNKLASVNFLADCAMVQQTKVLLNKK